MQRWRQPAACAERDCATAPLLPTLTVLQVVVLVVLVACERACVGEMQGSGDSTSRHSPHPGGMSAWVRVGTAVAWRCMPLPSSRAGTGRQACARLHARGGACPRCPPPGNLEVPKLVIAVLAGKRASSRGACVRTAHGCSPNSGTFNTHRTRPRPRACPPSAP